MEPEIQPPQPPAPPADRVSQADLPSQPAGHGAEEKPYRGLRWIFIGSQGLRAGWSALLFIFFTFVILIAMGDVVRLITGHRRHGAPTSLSPFQALISETLSVLAILGAGALMALIERRRIMDYNLTGSNRVSHFLGGLVAGFAALSALVGALAWGHWLHFGPVALGGAPLWGFGAVWALAFLLTGFFEEGSFRCYLQFTLTRGINFWWALGIVALLCASATCLNVFHKIGSGDLQGVYIVAILLLIPCLVLHLKRIPGSGFWYAAWVTSTLFGFVHTGNHGEDWIGIFSAGAIGFVFCVSIWVTGSAWWAIGCHAAWDWGETFFYGTADSGLVPKGHFLTTGPAGNPFWSGGSVGPEGSVLVLGAILLLLVLLLLVYGRRRPAQPAAETVTG
jgi:membrane protease YdiL (CAAX protease family)